MDRSTDLRRSPLDARHRERGATMLGFGGWDMPLDYGSVVAEHRAVREACGVFDLSHLGTIRVAGPGAAATVGAAFTNDADSLPIGRAHYTLCLTADGGILDDLLVYHFPGAYLVVPNAANTAAVLDVLLECADGREAEVADVKQRLAVIAVQGPESDAVLARAGVEVDGLGYLDCRGLPHPEPDAWDVTDGAIARSGYTGERGYELFVRAEEATRTWDRVVEAGATPAGLGARDTLRLEMGYPLHGNDISPSTSPVAAGLGWAVKPEHDFRGRDAYLRAKQQGASRRLRGLRVTARGIPRAHCVVYTGDQPVGETTSGTFSPTLRTGIALGYLDTEIPFGTNVEIDVRGKRLPAEVVRPPLVDRSPKD